MCLIAVYKSETLNSWKWLLWVLRLFQVDVMKKIHAMHPISMLSHVK